jgi:hypothetical protein
MSIEKRPISRVAQASFQQIDAIPTGRLEKLRPVRPGTCHAPNFGEELFRERHRGLLFHTTIIPPARVRDAEGERLKN